MPIYIIKITREYQVEADDIDKAWDYFGDEEFNLLDDSKLISQEISEDMF